MADAPRSRAGSQLLFVPGKLSHATLNFGETLGLAVTTGDQRISSMLEAARAAGGATPRHE